MKRATAYTLGLLIAGAAAITLAEVRAQQPSAPPAGQQGAGAAANRGGNQQPMIVTRAGESSPLSVIMPMRI